MFTGPNIVTDGLILHLDAANVKSYPGSGTAWYDLSGNENHCTLYNSPTFTNSTLLLDGVNDYVKSTGTLDLSGTDAVTILYFLKLTSYGTAIKILHELSTNFNGRTDSFVASFSDNSAGQNYEVFTSIKGNTGYNISAYDKTLVNDLAWHHHSVEHNMSRTGKESILYSDGQLSVPLTSLTNTYNNNNTGTFGNQPLYIGSRAGTQFFSPMSIGNVLLYNRALSAEEVLQNYNATKSRFGL